MGVQCLPLQDWPRAWQSSDLLVTTSRRTLSPHARNSKPEAHSKVTNNLTSRSDSTTGEDACGAGRSISQASVAKLA